MRFGLPLLLTCLVAVPLVLAIVVWGVRQRRAAETRFAGSGLTALRSGRISPARRWLKSGLLIVVAGLLALSVARPQLGQTHVVLPREGSDIVIILDVSRSMGVTDVKPSRLDRAKQDATAVIDHLNGDRIGLVTFAGSSTLRFPLTTDANAARQVVDGIATKDGGLKPGTDIAGAIAAAREAFTGDKTRSKVVLLISDGEDLTGNDLVAAKDAAGAGLIIHTIGVGTAQGGPVFAVSPRTNRSEPVIDPATGTTAISHRDDGNLRDLAVAGRGSAYDGNTTDFAFDLSGSIGRLEKTRFESGETTIPIERFQIPLALALVLLVLESVIAESATSRQRSAVSRQQTASRQGSADAYQPRPPSRKGGVGNLRADG